MRRRIAGLQFDADVDLRKVGLSLADSGLSQQLLYDVEYGDRRLLLHELILLAECYGVSADDVLGVDLGVAQAVTDVDAGFRRLPG